MGYNYYQLMQDHYKTISSRSDDLLDMSSVIDDLLQQGYLSYNVIVDGVYDKQMLIYEHIDPIQGKQNDMRAICLDKDNIHWGNVISLEDGRNYMAITSPDWNEAYNKYRIRELTDDLSFNLTSPVNIKCVIANKQFYDDISFVNETNVFEDKDLRATIIQYNDDTKALTLFDDVEINNNQYKIVKIDNHTLKEYDEEYGVLQLVIIDTPFGEIRVVNEGIDKVIKGVVMTARVKDKILNSISRELCCNIDEAKCGDYIYFTYDRNNKNKVVTDIYIVANRPTMESGYDKSLMYLCDGEVRILDDEGNVVTTPVYFEDNRTRIDKLINNESVKFRNSSFLIMVQDNQVTHRLVTKCKRLIIKDRAYDIVDYDDNSSSGMIMIGLNSGQIDPNDDFDGVANYYSQMKEIEDNKPPEPTESIVEVNNMEELYIGYANTYLLQGAGSGVTWSVDVSWITLTQDGTRCTLEFNNRKYVNKSVILYADYGGNIFEKTIQAKGL